MRVRMVATGQYHPRIRRNCQVKPVKYALTLVDLTQLLVQVLGDVEGLHGHLIIPHVPDLKGKIVA